LKLERVKATRRNRIIVLTAGSFAMLVTTLLILWAFLKTRNHAPTVQVGDNCSNLIARHLAGGAAVLVCRASEPNQTYLSETLQKIADL
jgi:hypothetical protein